MEYQEIRDYRSLIWIILKEPIQPGLATSRKFLDLNKLRGPSTKYVPFLKKKNKNKNKDKMPTNTFDF